MDKDDLVNGIEIIDKRSLGFLNSRIVFRHGMVQLEWVKKVLGGFG